jgi:hypothetical protein
MKWILLLLTLASCQGSVFRMSFEMVGMQTEGPTEHFSDPAQGEKKMPGIPVTLLKF